MDGMGDPEGMLGREERTPITQFPPLRESHRLSKDSPEATSGQG
jgi:hypothetical protein